MKVLSFKIPKTASTNIRVQVDYQAYFYDTLHEVRVAQVCRLLLNEDLTIAQICFQCGFGNLSQFNRVFKVIHGISPKSYRKKKADYVLS